jgi:hypothetical protein
MGGYRRSSRNAGERTAGAETLAEKIGCRTIASRNSRSRCAGASARTKDPKLHTTMTDKMLKNLVTEAVSLDRDINEKADRLKELKAELIAEARNCDSEFALTDGGGRRWTAEGSDGCIARVTFPAPTLKAKIGERRKLFERIKNLAGGVFTHLFVPITSYRPIEKFREEAAALLPKADANKLIKLCQTASAPRVSFETTERQAA